MAGNLIDKQIVAVVVLYKRKPEASETLSSLASVFTQSPGLLQSMEVVIWDNSPTPLQQLELPFPFTYQHSGRNAGTSGAYNKAMEFAEARGAPWMLLFDQDTTVANGFIPRMLEYSHSLQDSSEVGSVVPFVYSHGHLVSPRLLRSFNRNLQVPLSFHGVLRERSYGINSSALLRVAALREIGGYSEDFWLDLSDVDTFQRMFWKGRYMYVASDLVLQHSLSGEDYDREMTVERYRNFLAAESAFVDLYSSRIERIAQLYRLFVRVFRQYRKYQNKAFARLAWSYFLQRLFHRRAERLAKWRQQLTKRDIPMMSKGKMAG